jgi:hypothetical protein
VSSYKELKTHLGHRLVCVENKNNVSIRCVDCGHTLLDYNEYETDRTKTLKEDVLGVMQLEDFSMNEQQINTVVERLNNYDYSEYNDAIADIIREVIGESDPTEDEEARKNSWWAAGEWIPCPEHNKEDIDAYSYYQWDGDFKSPLYDTMFGRANLSNENPDKVYIYSLIEEDGEGYISEGKRFINRIGYFFSKVYIEVKEPTRFW